MQSNFLRILSERGFISQATDLADLDALAAAGPVTGYIGFDLTADSLHVGSLIQIMVLRWMIVTGNNPIILLGEATTRIGDPTGKDKARPILTDRQIALNWQGISMNLDALVGRFAHQYAAHLPMLTNAEWFDGMKMMEYLQEYGPHFSINRMLTFDSVVERLSKNDHMSFLEFNYMLFQAIDFLHLSRSKDCVLQIGGSDQWGNIVNGVELIRRVDQKRAFGLTTPLMANTAGEKMGKTAGGAIWLDAKKTPPFDFYQFWRNVEDDKVGEFLKLFTNIPLDVIDEMLKRSINWAKVQLAVEVTGMVHGETAAQDAHRAAEALSRGEIDASKLPRIEIERQWLFEGGLGAGNVPQTVGALFVQAGMTTSKNDAAKLAENGGLKLNGAVTTDVRRFVASEDVVDGEIVLQKGKKTAVVLKVV